MALARGLGRPPRDLADAVREKLADRQEFAAVAVAGGGFINLTLSDDFLSACASVQAASPDLGIAPSAAGQTVMLDFGGPNVAKPLHVGHLRSLVIGESLRRILSAQGARTISDIHLGDWGLQIGMLISALRGKPVPSMEELQTLYPAVAAACKDDPVRMAQARAATAALQAGEPEAMALWRSLRAVSLAAQSRDIHLLGAHFDLLLGESDVQELIAPMVAELRARGVAEPSEGALVITVASPDDGKPMPPLLLEKSDGAALYATTDLATILARTRPPRPDRILYVVDQRQALHFEQLFRAARKAGFVDGVDLVHVGFGTVNGLDGKPYRTRAGGVARLADLLGEAIGKAAERLPETPPELDREALARLVGLAAVKFADLSSFRTSGYVFDAERLVSFEGRTGPYVQYACVRIASILARAATQGAYPGTIALAAPTERALALECARLPDVVAGASRNLAPNEIADYAFALAQSFSRFYTECPVLGAASDAERASRLALCGLVLAVQSKALWLLGIAIPPRM